MPEGRSTLGLGAALAVFAMIMFVTGTCAAQHETVLHSFNGADGFRPLAGLILDAAGNFYGTSDEGGIHSFGAVFEMSPRRERRLDGDGAAQLRQRHGRLVSRRSRPGPRCCRQSLRHDLQWRHSSVLRDGVRVVAQRGRRLDGDGAAQLRQRHGRALAPTPA